MPWETRENAEARMPDNESVGLAGLVLIEAFPPSLAATLTRLVRDWPTGQARSKDSALRLLAASRSDASGGTVLLGTVRRPGQFIMADGWHDPDLPDGVDAACVTLLCKTQSLAVVAASFILSPQAGDLSPLLRADRRSDRSSSLHVRGFASGLRAKNPWSRPKNVNPTYSIGTVKAAKANACEQHMNLLETQCHAWLARHFPGRLAQRGPHRRPIARVMLCDSMTPFTRQNEGWRPVILGPAREVWRAEGGRGWSLSTAWSPDEHQSVMTFAARRGDVEAQHVEPGTERSNWAIMQEFEDSYVGLIARYSLVALLGIYKELLGDVRDNAGAERGFHRPVRTARELDRFLVRDGLDVTAIARDIRSLTRRPVDFRWDLVPFEQDLSDYPPAVREARTPAQFVPHLSDWLQQLATDIPEDADALTANIRASADLRQAISNTRLQRVSASLAVIAVIIAVISVLVALHPPK